MNALFKVKKALFIYKYYNPATQLVAKLYLMAKDTGFDSLLKQDMRRSCSIRLFYLYLPNLSGKRLGSYLIRD